MGNIRVTVVVSLVLICGSFMAAAAIQMRSDRARALAEAQSFDERRANEIALDLSAALDRYAAIGAAFANATTSAETSAALSEAGGSVLRNIAVLDTRGQLQSELTGSPEEFLPLSPTALETARHGRAVVSSRDGRSFAIAFGAGPHIVAVQLDAKALMPSASEEEALVATLSGRVIAPGAQWRALPNAADLLLDGERTASRIVDVADGKRLVALERVSGWPLAVGASSRVETVLDAWYGALPLYFFFIFGPALAGAGLAVVFVQEFERRARTTEAMRKLRATKPEEAKLLVRLADAERRAGDAERAQREFMGHMSHEFRTPLNAIIGFSEVIEKGVFGLHGKYSEYARDIGVAGRELHAKIGDILDFANLDTGGVMLAREAVDVVAVLREAVDSMASDAQARGIRLTVTLPMTARALGDTAAIRRIAIVLLDNAVRYSHSGGTIRLQARSADEGVIVSVQDRGFGISSEELARLGRPFCRFDRPGAQTGSGMGLATAMSFARHMGGRLCLASVEGEGTTAELILAKA